MALLDFSNRSVVTFFLNRAAARLAAAAGVPPVPLM
jgi:hypothetical protein